VTHVNVIDRSAGRSEREAWQRRDAVDDSLRRRPRLCVQGQRDHWPWHWYTARERRTKGLYRTFGDGIDFTVHWFWSKLVKNLT